MQALIALAVVTALVLLVLIRWTVSIYNNLVQVKNNSEKAFKNIDVLLQQRHDEIPKLVAAVRGYMTHERTLLDALTELRERYRSATTSQQKTTVENRINRVMAQVAARWEAYPDLKANQGFLALQSRISALETNIADRREFFNDSVNIYNIQIERFPDILLATLLGYQKRAYLEVPGELKQDVTVSFPETA